MEPLLEIRGLSVAIGKKTILKDIDLSITAGSPAVLFGPNGSGKSTLIKAILGFEGYTVTRGEIRFKGERIDALPTDERVRKGIGIMFQNPPAIRGVTLKEVAGFFHRDREAVAQLAQRLSLSGHLDRDLNLGFSGGEMKRSELFQVILQDPELLLLDEPESGVDLENIAVMGRALREFLAKPGKTALMITHTGYILEYVRSENGCMMINGKLWCVGNPVAMFEDIKRHGYERCMECRYDRRTTA